MCYIYIYIYRYGIYAYVCVNILHAYQFRHPVCLAIILALILTVLVN